MKRHVTSQRNLFGTDPGRILVLAFSGALLICYISIFIQFFPNRFGFLNQDFAIFLPALLDGFFWFKINGPWQVPWFTPSFSGGAFNYLNLQSGYYTVPQWLTFLVDPLTAVQVTFILFAAVGYGGCFLLLRSGFHAGRRASLLGACLFLFSGFYSHRMIGGHFGAHPFMLLPWIVLLLVRPMPATDGFGRARQFLLDSILAGLLFAYMVQTWFVILVIPAVLAIAAVGLMHGILHGRRKLFWGRLAGAGGAGLLFSASKIVATFYLMTRFDRSAYLLPGAASFPKALGLLFRTLFVSPALDPGRSESLRHLQWYLGRTEWEFSLTPVPLVIVAIGAVWLALGRLSGRVTVRWTWRQGLQAGAILALLLIPAALNTYAPAWNAMLKQMPLVKSASTLIRWFLLPVPFVVVATALVFDRLPIWKTCKTVILMLAIGAVVVINAVADREEYHQQYYDPQPIVSAYWLARSGALKPQIRFIGAYRDADGHYAIPPAAPNDGFIHGISPMLCYDPFFGYRQELFPLGEMRPGAVMSERNGILNLKNPACYIWPQDNGCAPGDHFKVGQKSAATDFVNYRPFAFRMSGLQRAANGVNLVSLLVAAALLLIEGIGRCLKRGAQRMDAPPDTDG